VLSLDHTRELMARAQTGDTAAFGELCTEARPFIRGVLRRCADLDFATIDDLTQETLLRAWRFIGTYRPGPDVRPWLAIIARHVAADWFRMRGARFAEDLMGLPGDVPTPGHDPFPAVDDHEQVVTVLAALSEDHRQVLTMHYLDELSSPEIAALTGLADGTVKSRLTYARRAARKLAVADA
jgi:RNA polymerase sigma-70 factor (ECF subfamily)